MSLPFSPRAVQLQVPTSRATKLCNFYLIKGRLCCLRDDYETIIVINSYYDRRPQEARPKTLNEDMVRVETTVPREAADAIETLVAMTGASKATFLRQVFILGLSAYQMASDDVAATIPATTYKNKEK